MHHAPYLENVLPNLRKLQILINNRHIDRVFSRCQLFLLRPHYLAYQHHTVYIFTPKESSTTFYYYDNCRVGYGWNQSIMLSMHVKSRFKALEPWCMYGRGTLPEHRVQEPSTSTLATLPNTIVRTPLCDHHCLSTSTVLQSTTARAPLPKHHRQSTTAWMPPSKSHHLSPTV